MLGLEGVPPPELAICSAAVRTRQTADLVVEAMGGRLPVEATGRSTGPTPNLCSSYVREIDEGVRAPWSSATTRRWSRWPGSCSATDDGDDPSTDRAILEAHGFPTCALAVLTLEVGAWEDVAHGCADLAGVFKPPY